MITPDIINGLFELCGGLLYILNIRSLLKHRTIKGVSWISTLFFTAFGAWNLYYYPFLNQPFSLAGGIVLFLTNGAWLSLLLYFKYAK